MSDINLLLIVAFAAIVLIAAFMTGRSQGREEMVHRLLGMKRANNRWEVAENTRIMGMKWVLRHYVFTDGTQARRVDWKEEEDRWEFDDGSAVPSPLSSGLVEVPGHWELPDGQRINPLQMNPLELANAFHEWAKNASKVVDLGIASLQLLPIVSKMKEQEKIIKEYGKVLEQHGPIFRRESELPFPKEVIRRGLANALLISEQDEKTRNALAVGFAQLEFFLPPEEADCLNHFFEVTGDKRNLELADRARRGEDVSAEMRNLAMQIVGDGSFQTIWNRILKREGERLYQLRVLKSIAVGETDPDMLRLMSDVNKEVEEGGERIAQAMSKEKQ